MNEDDIKEGIELGLIKNRCNVGITPFQMIKIKKLVKKGKYKSINQFVIKAVDNMLKK